MHRQILAIVFVVSGMAADAAEWYRGNTHAHTKLCGHGDSTAEAVANWYRNNEYDFLVISENNLLIDPDDVTIPEKSGRRFILIPGQEISTNEDIHTTAINIDRLVPWQFTSTNVPRLLQDHVDAIHDAHGIGVINHPLRNKAISAADIFHVNDVHLFELYSGNHDAITFGNRKDASTEKLWDSLLTAGIKMFAISSDDAHIFEKIATDVSNPGRGWIMVRASRLDRDTISNAIEMGNFYASTGVFLKTCDTSQNKYRIVIDDNRTRDEIAKGMTIATPASHPWSEGYVIEFIGAGGRILASHSGLETTYEFGRSSPYVRAKVTYTRRDPKYGYVQSYAWGPPFFFDNR